MSDDDDDIESNSFDEDEDDDFDEDDDGDFGKKKKNSKGKGKDIGSKNNKRGTTKNTSKVTNKKKNDVVDVDGDDDDDDIGKKKSKPTARTTKKQQNESGKASASTKNKNKKGDIDDVDDLIVIEENGKDSVNEKVPKSKKVTKATATKSRSNDDDDDDENDSLLDDDDDEVKMATPTKKTTKPRKKKIDDEDDEDKNMEFDDEDITKNKNNKGRSSHEKKKLANKYQKVSQYEHVLLRPDTYIGSIEKNTQRMWVMEEAANGEYLTNKEISFVPGLYKIFDEILVNAADHKRRDPTMKAIKVVIQKETGLISVWNDGNGIPVEIHPDHHVYYPDFLFGDLLTGENFDDNESRLVGGRNGYGAKLANIFSSQFEVETQDSKSEQNFYKKWTANMSKSDPPVISKYKGKTDYTKVSFIPDYARFGMDGLDDDTLSLLTKRVYDMAGVTEKSVSVWLNGSQIKISGFEKYVDLYLKRPSNITNETEDLQQQQNQDVDEEKDDDNEDLNETLGSTDDNNKKKKKASNSAITSGFSNSLPKIYEKINDRWEICVSISDGQAEQVSFVNSICTSKGGQHVQYIAEQISTFLIDVIRKKNKSGAAVKPHQIKSHLWIFVNCLIVNPAFDSQTKDTLSTKPPKFGEKAYLPTISPNTFGKISKSGVIENILFWANAKSMRDLKKIAGAKKARIIGITKLNDANNAGGKDSDKCTLILTEGDSAMSLALTGISVVGRDYYGVFPLKGKLLNVRDATHSQIMKNEEIQNIMKIIGLQPGKVYDTVKGLRYGHVMVMTDQDQDGSHIKGLLFNFFHHFWPSLVHMDGFLRVFITPIVKVSKKNEVLSFFSLPDYEDWKKTLTKQELGKWTVKYYKGLGTNNSQEAAKYFVDIDKHQIDMKYEGQIGDNSIDMAFSKKRVNDRKLWLESFKPETRVDFDVDSMSYSDFVNQELIQFSMADNCRSIPNINDGLKTSQRKVLFAVFKRGLKTEIKVAQFAGYVAEHSAYHHGEVSLTSTIVGMAQDFVGSNNINLLFPSGAFGTRRLGGKDAASARYIFTRVGDITRYLFRVEDDDLFPPLNDDGQDIEPSFYLPIIPTVLVNGASGIGTGWSTDIPPFNPIDIINSIRSRIKGLTSEPLSPWYRGFTGTIVPEKVSKKSDTNPDGNPVNTGRFIITGKYSLNNTKESIRINELPIGTWTNSYKEWLEELMQNDKSQESKTGEKTKSTAATTETNNNNSTDDNNSAKKNTKKKQAPKKKTKKNKDGGSDDDEEGGNGADLDNDEDDDFQGSDKDSSDDENENKRPSKPKKGNGTTAARVKPVEEVINLAGNIKEIRENHGDNTVDFEIFLTTEVFQKISNLSEEKILKKFRLITTVSTSNMIAFNSRGSITKYSSCEEILDEFYQLRKDYYVKRKQLMENKLSVEVNRATELARFVSEVANNKIIVSNRKMKDLLNQLVLGKFKKLHEINEPVLTLKSNLDLPKKTTDEAINDDEEYQDFDAASSSLLSEYSYLIKTGIYNLTSEKVKKHLEEARQKQYELDQLKLKTPNDLWESDLNELEDQIRIASQQKLNDDIVEKKIRKNAPKRKGAPKSKRSSNDNKKNKRNRDFSDDDDDEDEDEDDDFSDDYVAKKSTRKPPTKKQATISTAKKNTIEEYIVEKPKAKSPSPTKLQVKEILETSTKAEKKSSLSLADRLEKRLEISEDESKKEDDGKNIDIEEKSPDIKGKKPIPSKAKGKGKINEPSKKVTSKNKSKSIDVDYESENENEKEKESPPKKSRPTRAAANNKKAPIYVQSESSEDGEDSDEEIEF